MPASDDGPPLTADFREGVKAPLRSDDTFGDAHVLAVGQSESERDVPGDPILQVHQGIQLAVSAAA